MRTELVGQCVGGFDRREPAWDQDCECVVPARGEPVCLWKGDQDVPMNDAGGGGGGELWEKGSGKEKIWAGCN